MHTVPVARTFTGSSPRVRGKPPGRGVARAAMGLIPARAGKTLQVSEPRMPSSAHPRACGENARRSGLTTADDGSSPRVRGKRPGGLLGRDPRGLIPARAGKTCPASCRSRPPSAHPRACGENYPQRPASHVVEGSSPRVRGKPARSVGPEPPSGLIPARAGKTSQPTHRRAASSAHPRACGENSDERALDGPGPGSSPRVRGKPVRGR